MLFGAFAAGACADLGGLAGGGDASAAQGDAGYCAAHPATFCDDFDEAPLGALWTMSVSTAGTTSLDADASVSPPNSLYAQTADGGGIAVLEKDFTGAASGVRCELDVRIDRTDGDLEVFNIGFQTTDPSRQGYNLSIHESVPTATTFIEFARGADGGITLGNGTLLFPALPVGEGWTHLGVTVTLVPPAATITFDGTTISQIPLSPPPTNLGQVLLAGGTTYAKGATVHEDNLRCDITP